jgi:Uma2 family endonuclease
VDGVPQLTAGGTVRHFQIVRNVTIAMHVRLRGGPCQALPDGVKVFTARGNFRYPDALVDCGSPKPGDLAASAPRVVVEVESPSTTFLDELARVEDYQSVPAIEHIVILSQTRPRARVLSRAGSGWTHIDYETLEAALALPAIGCELPLAEVYEQVAFDEPPQA